MTTKKRTIFIVQAAVIAALYVTLTFLQNFIFPGSASMAIQFRVSEVLTMLAIITPAAIPGLTIGCIFANISSVALLGPYDMIFGSLASLLAAICMYYLRNVRFKGLPIIAAIMPAIFNGIIIGWEIEFFFIEGGFHFNDFLIQGGFVALGELAVCLTLGLAFVKLIERLNLSKRLMII